MQMELAVHPASCACPCDAKDAYERHRRRTAQPCDEFPPLHIAPQAQENGIVRLKRVLGETPRSYPDPFREPGLDRGATG